MWGQVIAFCPLREESRIIPTRVGTSIPITIMTLIIGDHPHACGDKVHKYRQLTDFRGSSPRVWGQDINNGKRTKCARIIPTRVGTRTSQTHFRTPLKDHPHACGDKCLGNLLYIAFLGSSPRVWGQEL